ncbi:MAG: alpha-L-rhamnosidase-related protein [Ginsengibacter sp.]
MRIHFLSFIVVLLSSPVICHAQSFSITNNPGNQTVTIGNSNLKIVVDYNHGCRVSAMEVNGINVIAGNTGIYSAIQTKDKTFSTLQLKNSPKMRSSKNSVEINDIVYGDANVSIHENWKFIASDSNIQFSITRSFPKSFEAESVSFPAMEFNNINTWEGAFQGFGGIAWFYLFNEKLMTYGVHTNEVSFWNSANNNGLHVLVNAPGKHVAMKYSRTDDDKLDYSIAVSQKEMLPRYDSGTQRRRFIRKKTDVWAPFKILAGTSTQSISFSAFNYAKKYGRGEFKGVNGKQVTSVLNTIARMGVIDAKHFGGNSWHTPYGPICLHEQYIAQLGVGINDPHYLNGYKQCLDFYRDNAIKPDGRVWSRWAYTNGDAMPGQFTDKGFYEAQWGYLLDSNPDYVSNVSDLYNQTGDIDWVRKQQKACEKALDYLLKRDFNGNHLVEMMNDSHTQNRSSDWIDIIWASYENAFVNAKLYHALCLWSDIEQQLGNKEKASYYSDFAEQLKISFNKSVHQGGFWDEDKGYYDYWRDKDESVHGDNLVTPVNFMAIAYGICDDTTRRNSILEKVETEMQKEKLFFWPISFFPYKTDEGKEYQFPFPNYENGDIFLSWGSVAVQAYASWKPALALHYIKNILKQYSIDGLAFQRYSRKDQSGKGDDILSGNSLGIVGLYQSVYGFNPLYNRFYLDPHITSELSGSRLYYDFRGERLIIGLDTNLYSVSNKRFTISSKNDFGYFSVVDTVMYFHKDNPVYSLKAIAKNKNHLNLQINECNSKEIIWEQSSPGASFAVMYFLNDLLSNRTYLIYGDDILLKKTRTDAKGNLIFNQDIKTKRLKIVLEN